MTNRIHEYLDRPSNFTRLLSAGRQLCQLKGHVYNITPNCAAAKALRTTRVKVVGMIINDTASPPEAEFHVVRAEGMSRPGDASSAIVKQKDLE